MFLAMSVFPLAHPSIQFHHFAPSNHRTTSAHRYPTCPSLLRYHHFDPSHYTGPSLSHLPILQSDIITSIHRTISARCYPTCPSSNPIHHFDSSTHRYPTYPSFNPISSLRFIALYQPTALHSTYHGNSLLSRKSTMSM